MRKIIVLVLGTASAGELTIAYEFVSRLPKDRYQVLFIIPAKYSGYLDNKGFRYIDLDVCEKKEKNRDIIFRSIDSFSPDYLFISDVYTLEYSASWSGVRFYDLKNMHIPVIGVDEYEFASTNYCVDYYGANCKKLPPFIEECDFIVRDCPINNHIRGGKNIWYFSLYNKIPEIREKDKLEVRKKLGIEDDEKIIFTTTSYWESINMHQIPALNSFIKWIPVLLLNYISELNRKVAIIHVGCNQWPVPAGRKIKYFHFDSLLPSDFDMFLTSCDLFLTLNIVSVTLTKAIFANVPCIVFQNKKLLRFSKLKQKLDTMPGWYRMMAEEVRVVYPFRASTFGWYKFLEPVLRDNKYSGTFIEAPFLKMKEAVSLLDEYLYNQDSIERLKKIQRSFAEEILKLDTPEKIMREIDARVHG